MSRYTGPRLKIMRALAVQLPGLSGKTWDERRPYPPGAHQGRHRKKASTFAVQLREKQKLRYNYGVSEKQLRRYVGLAFKSRGEPGDFLLGLLEGRLDNVVFRSGFARTIPQARQLVTHGHIVVDGRKVDKPSFQVKAGQLIGLGQRIRDNAMVELAWKQPALVKPDWLEIEDKAYQAKVILRPDRESVPFPVEVKSIVEFYSR